MGSTLVSLTTVKDGFFDENSANDDNKSGRRQGRLQKVAAGCAAAAVGHRVRREPVFTECRGHATELATQYAGAFPYLLVLGGDGTLAEAIAGLMPLAERPKVGYIPIGTANDVARTIGLPKNDILAGAQHFIGGTPHEFDEGRRDGGYFNYVAAFGAFTEVSYATPQEAKKQLGEAAYLLGAVKSLSTLKSRHVTVEYDDGCIEGEFLYGSMSNSYSVAGLIDLPRDEIKLGDGLHELVLVKNCPTRRPWPRSRQRCSATI